MTPISSPITYLTSLSYGFEEYIWLLFQTAAIGTTRCKEGRHTTEQIPAATRREGFRTEEMSDLELEPGEDFKRLRTRIARTASLPVDNLGKPSGAAIDPTMYVTLENKEPSDDLVHIFRKMLGIHDREIHFDDPILDSINYEHDLSNFLHNGRSYNREDPITRKALEDKYFEEKRKQKERDARIAVKLNIVTTTEKKDTDVTTYKFRCYNTKCGFATDSKSDYENHGVNEHLGKPCYPGKVDIRLYGWTLQGKRWEI